MYMSIITKRNKKFAHSCLIEELTKKSMSSEGKFCRLSVLVALPIEKLEAQRRRLKFQGLAQSIISGKELNIDLQFATQAEVKEALSKLSKQRSSIPGKKLKIVQFKIPVPLKPDPATGQQEVQI